MKSTKNGRIFFLYFRYDMILEIKDLSIPSGGLNLLKKYKKNGN